MKLGMDLVIHMNVIPMVGEIYHQRYKTSEKAFYNSCSGGIIKSFFIYAPPTDLVRNVRKAVACPHTCISVCADENRSNG